MLFDSTTPIEELLKQAEQILIPWIPKEEIQELDEDSPLLLNYKERRIKLTGNGRSDCLDVNVTADELLTVIEALLENEWGYLATITGVDLGVEAGQLEVLYHFCHGAAVVTLSVKVPRDNAVVPSVCGIIPSASFYERELLEMFGITITNTPNTDHLFLPDNWPENVYPLRKDFEMPSAN